MCGIAGVFSQDSTYSWLENLEESVDLLSSRGPDDRGIELFELASGTLGLGHTRLSIIDLSSAGHQPMKSIDGRFSIVFNGEIYNYKEIREELETNNVEFISDSDTEVLLRAWQKWGASCIRRFVGMFAFVVFDSALKTLTLVRDAFGIKPLFFSIDRDLVAFGSEIRAVLPLVNTAPKLDRQTARTYLIDGAYDCSTRTFFEGINQLAPGHIATIKLAGAPEATISQWWSPRINQASGLSFDEASERLKSLFLASVDLHLRSDVPLCINLSGGIDSSAIACAVRFLHPTIPINTVSYIATDSPESEELWIDIVNKHINATSHKVELTGHDLARDLDDLIIAQGEPFVSSSVYAGYVVFRQVRAEGFVVSLDGQGADELMAGYDGYPHGLIDSLLRTFRLRSAVKFFFAWSAWPGRSKRLALQYIAKNIRSKWLWGLLYLLVGRTRKPKWLNDVDHSRESESLWDRHQEFDKEREIPGRTLAGVLRTALTKQGLAALLRHGDRNSMRWSVESRVPYLTTELAEFCLALPEDYLLSMAGETKHIFRAAMRGVVPDQILDRKDKIGFKTPEEKWIREQKSVIREWVKYAHKIEMIDGVEFEQEINKVLNGEKRYSPLTWRMINFVRWAALHEISD